MGWEVGADNFAVASPAARREAGEDKVKCHHAFRGEFKMSHTKLRDVVCCELQLSCLSLAVSWKSDRWK